MNIDHVVCVRSNWFAEIKTGMIIGEAPANEIVVCALVPPTTGEPWSWRIPKELYNTTEYIFCKLGQSWPNGAVVALTTEVPLSKAPNP